ncbi:hypothetical protein [Niabella ginsengisoli]|uniref:Uncharacterized protein n=1 Tax=Niabella ginsengisoli TaxID=522298 RepID=A0ABS9SGS0_9BACT|nr:hypothetical protein [Niabella ginsengisoli]MCH5597564.1 hypothetical protein [Niabella ginsengisoli]
MAREILETKRKALKINLDASVYGTFAEIGAGQEVARNFLQLAPLPAQWPKQCRRTTCLSVMPFMELKKLAVT